jgi:DegV family protein with EDD domain
MAKIICDSTGDLTPDIIKKYDIGIVPLNIHFGQETFQDGITITPEVFYKRLVSDHVHPTTSAPAPGAFLELYKKLAKETDEIMVITISGGISATWESAVQAKNMLEGTCQVEVIDSQETCGALFLPALKAAQAAQQGAKLKEITPMVRDVLSRTKPYMIFDTLEYLRKGGRIGKASALLGSMLKLNPIITLKDGVIESVAKPRSWAKAKDELFKIISESGGIEEMVLEAATAFDQMEEMAERFSAICPKEKMYRSTVSPVIGVHSGPSVIAATVLLKK